MSVEGLPHEERQERIRRVERVAEIRTENGVTIVPSLRSGS